MNTVACPFCGNPCSLTTGNYQTGVKAPDGYAESATGLVWVCRSCMYFVPDDGIEEEEDEIDDATAD